jgi:hypothetical protein
MKKIGILIFLLLLAPVYADTLLVLDASGSMAHSLLGYQIIGLFTRNFTVEDFADLLIETPNS